MLDRFHRLARNRQTFIVLLVAAVAFFSSGTSAARTATPLGCWPRSACC